MALAVGHPGSVVSDKELDLIDTYRMLQKNPETIFENLNGLPQDADWYYYLRDEDEEDWTPAQHAARVLYLNRTCFNGLWRKNKAGKFNMPIGKPPRPLPTLEELREFSKVIQGFEFFCEDFQPIIELAEAGDVLYIDSPYDGTFTGYSAGGFGLADQQRLALSLFDASQRGAIVIAHNSATDLVATLYEDWADIEILEESRAINSNGKGRGKVPCVLITSNV